MISPLEKHTLEGVSKSKPAICVSGMHAGISYNEVRAPDCFSFLQVAEKLRKEGGGQDGRRH